MIKICLIQEILKDSDFKNGEEKINFQILKALSSSDFQVDIFCIKNNLTDNLNLHNITELAAENFCQNAVSIASRLNYDLTFATDYLPTDVAYIHQHSNAYREEIVKSKMESLFYAIFSRKKYIKSQNENKKQTRFAQQYKAILTPSTILKNDLINLLKVDGQKVYIVPPFVDMPDIVTENSNKTFTFGFIGNDFYEKGGFLLLKALKNLTNFDFKLKILTNSSRNILLQRYIKGLKLDDKIEFVPHLTGMEEFYSDVDCLIMPSKRESFGLEVLEAMSYGKMVVISSRCGVKDIIEPFNNGFIFDITQKQVRNLERVLEYILINKDDFDNLRQKAVFTASVYNFEKFRGELLRLLAKFASNKEDK